MKSYFSTDHKSVFVNSIHLNRSHNCSYHHYTSQQITQSNRSQNKEIGLLNRSQQCTLFSQPFSVNKLILTSSSFNASRHIHSQILLDHLLWLESKDKNYINQFGFHSAEALLSVLIIIQDKQEDVFCLEEYCL